LRTSEPGNESSSLADTLQGDLERGRLGLLLLLASGLHPLESGAGGLSPDETGRKCARLSLEQRGEGLRRNAKSSTHLARGGGKIGHGTMCGHGCGSASFRAASG